MQSATSDDPSYPQQDRFRLRPTMLAAGAGLLILCTIAVFMLFQQRGNSERWVRHTVIVQNTLADARIDRLRAEVALREFALSGDAADLAGFETMSASASKRLASLSAATVDSPQQADNLLELSDARSAYLSAVATVIASPGAGPDRARAVANWLESPRSRDLAARVQDSIVRIGDEEQRLLGLREARSDKLEFWARTVLTTGALLISLLIVVAAFEYRRYLSIMRRSTRRMLEDTSKRELVERQLALLADNATDAVFRLSLSGHFLYASPSTREIFGVAPEDVVDQYLMLGVHPDDRPALDDCLRMLAGGAQERALVQYRARRPDNGEWRWVESSVGTVLGPDGLPAEFIASVRDISRRKELEADLKSARIRAEAADVAKSSFLANMSHEIRTPMNGVIGFTELLLTSRLTREQRRHVELVADSGRAMMRLLNDILDLSKVEAGQMQVADEPFDLHHALNGCGRLVAPAIQQKSLTFAVDLSPDLPQTIHGDGLRLRQIVLNLLGNAAKFTLAGDVRLSALTRNSKSGERELVIVVKDTGIGVPPEKQATIFDPFVQTDVTTAHRFGGTGLGLSISARLAGLIGGTLVLSSAVGVGSTFTLTLPLREAEGSRQTDPKVVTDRTDGERRGCNVLVAEDHDVNQLLITAMLERLGCTVTIARDGAQCVDLVRQAIAAGTQFDVILMDTQMPILDGPGAARAIRAGGVAASDLPIIALTANAYADDVAASLNAGMQAHIAKPVTLAQLDAALRQWGPGARDHALPAPRPAGGHAILERYRARRDEALAAVDALIRRGVFEEDELAVVAEHLHKLAGTAAMFGQADLGAQAGALEVGLTDWPPADRARRVAAAAQSLRDAA